MKVVMRDIAKSFGGNVVLKAVTFDMVSGEVHALMGENGAGKSTLMNILTGLHKQDKGVIEVDGVEMQFSTPKEAEEHGFVFIHQEMNIFSHMTVVENLFLGKEIQSKFGFLNNKKMEQRAREIFNELNVQIDLHAVAGELSVGQQQMIEIAKALITNSKLIIMDEPTAALTEKEIDTLFKIIDTLKKKGVAIIYISHRMEEIFKITDRITVMRDGVSIDTKNTIDTNVDEVVQKMVGRELEDYYPTKASVIGKKMLEVKNFTSRGVFENISFDVKAGEIVGFSGLMGSGRTEIMRAIFGMDSFNSGDILVEEKAVHMKNPVDAIKEGIGFLTEDRKEEGLLLDFSIRDNISLAAIDNFTNRLFVDEKDERNFAELMMKRLNVKATDEEMAVSNLSGGNQQKVVLAKWIATGSKILILDEPTRGVDVGAKREIYQLMNELADRGVAILMVSSDLPEVLGVSDRIVVVHEGKIAGELSKQEATEEKIMSLATGGYKHE